MKKIDITWKVFSVYILIIFLMLISGVARGQVVVTEFNAEWNKANTVKWLLELEDCDIAKVDIVKEPKLQTKHKIVVVPTIIVFKDGKEMKRFQADLSFKMVATREEVQEEIDNQLMSDF